MLLYYTPENSEEHNKQILHTTVLDIKIYYYLRNITYSEGSLISNTVKVQYLFYSPAYRTMSGLWRQKGCTLLSYQQRKATVTV